MVDRNKVKGYGRSLTNINHPSTFSYEPKWRPVEDNLKDRDVSNFLEKCGSDNDGSWSKIGGLIFAYYNKTEYPNIAKSSTGSACTVISQFFDY